MSTWSGLTVLDEETQYLIEYVEALLGELRYTRSQVEYVTEAGFSVRRVLLEGEHYPRGSWCYEIRYEIPEADVVAHPSRIGFRRGTKLWKVQLDHHTDQQMIKQHYVSRYARTINLWLSHYKAYEFVAIDDVSSLPEPVCRVEFVDDYPKLETYWGVTNERLKSYWLRFAFSHWKLIRTQLHESEGFTICKTLVGTVPGYVIGVDYPSSAKDTSISLYYYDPNADVDEIQAESAKLARSLHEVGEGIYVRTNLMGISPYAHIRVFLTD